MSDFLSRLSERALGVASVARPLIAPLFGPALPLANDPAGIELLPWNEASDEPPATSRGEVPPVRPAVPATRLSGLQPALSPSGPHAAVRELDDPIPLRPEMDHLAPINSQDPRSREPEHMPISVEGKPTPRVGPEASKIKVQATSLRSSLVPVTPAPLVASNDSSRTFWKTETAGRHELFNRAAPVSPAPTIRVTIGRVEVRAILPPALPVARTSPARSGSAPSLEDYLKRRDGGRP
jgi:hypothetical protein